MKSLPSDATVKNVRKGIISSGLTARYKHISAIRFADSSFSSRSFLLPVRNKNDRYATSGKRTVGWVIRIVEKFVKKKTLPSLILRCVRRGGRIISDLTLNPRQRINVYSIHVHSAVAKRGLPCVLPSLGQFVCVKPRIHE